VKSIISTKTYIASATLFGQWH